MPSDNIRIILRKSLDVTETSLLHLRERQRQSLKPVDAARDGVEVDRKPKLHALRFMLRQSECFDPLRSEAGSVLYLHRVHRTAVAVNAHDTITFFLKIKIPHCSTSCIAASSGSFASFYTPEYAANAPSIGIHAPLTNPLASSHARNRTEPISSSTSSAYCLKSCRFWLSVSHPH